MQTMTAKKGSKANLMTKETDTMASLPLLKDLIYREWHYMVNGF